MIARSTADLAPIVPFPDKIACVGVNYADHIAEIGRTPPDHPTYFAKYRRALIGPNDDIVLPPPDASVSVDWECELALVIGRPIRNATPAEALDAIGRVLRLERRLGARLADEDDPSSWPARPGSRPRPLGRCWSPPTCWATVEAWACRQRVNGEVKQRSSTEYLVFGPVEIVADLSRIMTLDPGDIITTGTPSGVGVARTPPQFLSPGDEVVVELEGVGRLVNRCVAA